MTRLDIQEENKMIDELKDMPFLFRAFMIFMCIILITAIGLFIAVLFKCGLGKYAFYTFGLLACSIIISALIEWRK